MLWHITKREIYDHLTSLRFVLTFGLTILLMVQSALLFVGSDYPERVQEYSKTFASTTDAVRRNTHSLSQLAEKGPIALYKRPGSLAFCTNAQDDALPAQIYAGLLGFETRSTASHSYSWAWPWRLAYVQDSYQKNSMLRPFFSLDWAFIVGVVMSFVGILFSFDAIAGERQHGTLALVVSNSVSRGTLLLGKSLGAFITISLPMLIGMLLSLLIAVISNVVSFSGSDWGRIALMAGISLVYVAIFIGLGLAVSSRVTHSATSLLILLMVWVVVVVLVPSTVGSAISTLHKIPTQLEFQRQREARIEQVKQIEYVSDEKMFQYGSPSDSRPNRKAIKLWANYITRRSETETRHDDEHLDMQLAQVQFARQILRVSPTTLYNYAMEALSGTGFERHRQYVRAARRYRGQFIEFIKETDKTDPESFHVYYLKEGLSDKPVSFESVPRFIEPTGAGIATRNALTDLSLLVLFSMLALMISYAAFLRCSVQ